MSMQELGIFRREKISNAIFEVATFVDWFRLWYAIPDTMSYGSCYKLELIESEMSKALAVDLKTLLTVDMPDATLNADFGVGGPFHSVIVSATCL